VRKGLTKHSLQPRASKLPQTQTLMLKISHQNNNQTKNLN